MESTEIAQAIAKAKKLRKAGQLVTHDRYKEMKAPKECKGIDRFGEEIIGYAYAPDYFIKSDVTGMMCRFYIAIDNVVMHPDELDKVSFVNGELKFIKRETIIVTWEDGVTERYGSFDNALYYTSGNKERQITFKCAGRSFTKPQCEWAALYRKLKTWVPQQGEKVLSTFQEWADSQE